jgi:hypothetical protein
LWLDVDELGGKSAEEQNAPVAVLPELEVLDFVHLNNNAMILIS